MSVFESNLLFEQSKAAVFFRSCQRESPAGLLLPKVCSVGVQCAEIIVPHPDHAHTLHVCMHECVIHSGWGFKNMDTLQECRNMLLCTHTSQYNPGPEHFRRVYLTYLIFFIFSLLHMVSFLMITVLRKGMKVGLENVFLFDMHYRSLILK